MRSRKQKPEDKRMGRWEGGQFLNLSTSQLPNFSSARLTAYVSRLTGSEKGMALLMTILIVVLLFLLIMDINERSYLALTRAKNSVNSLNASYIMRSGVSAAMGFLELDAKGSAVDTLTEEWAQEITRFPVGEGTVSVHIVDEASKFNINTLVSPQGKIIEKQVERFGRLLSVAELEDGLSSRVAEWLQKNREELSYSFADISELLLVPDFTIDTFKKIERYITVYTDRRNEFNININTVSREVLTALSPSLNETLVEAILEYRKEHPFKVERAGDLNQVTGFSDATLRTTFSDVLDVKSSDFTVKVEANVSDTIRKGMAAVNRGGGKVKLVAWKEE